MRPDVAPRCERVDGTERLRLHATDGKVYAVYDVTWLEGRYVKHPMGSPRATSRLFIPESGWWRSYAFGKEEPRRFDPWTLEHQLRGAAFVEAAKPARTAARPLTEWEAGAARRESGNKRH